MTFHAELIARTVTSSAAPPSPISDGPAAGESLSLQSSPLHDQVLGCPTRRLLGLPYRRPGGMRTTDAAGKAFASIAAEAP